MSLQWMDNFQGYGDKVRMVDGTPWTDLSIGYIAADPDPLAPAGSKAFKPYSGSYGPSDGMRLILTDPHNIGGLSCRIWLDQLPGGGGSTPGITFSDNFAGVLYTLRITPTGAMQLHHGGSSGALIAETSGPVIFSNSWNHIEFRVKMNTGEISVWKEGAPIPELSGITDPNPWVAKTVAAAGWYANWSAGGAGSFGKYFIKDVILYNGAGSANTGPLGVLSVFRLDPTSDISNGWAITGGGSATEVLDKPGGVNDATYISADDTLPAAAVMEFDALPPDIVGVRGLMMVGRLKKSSSGDANVQMSLLSNGAPDDGADRPVTTTYTYYWDISETDPDTTFTWSPTAVNAATIKLNRTV